MNMKFWEVVRTDLDPCSDRRSGTTILKRSANKSKVNKFVKEWETKWQDNLTNNYSECGHCWMDCENKLKVFTRELEDC